MAAMPLLPPPGFGSVYFRWVGVALGLLLTSAVVGAWLDQLPEWVRGGLPALCILVAAFGGASFYLHLSLLRVLAPQEQDDLLCRLKELGVDRPRGDAQHEEWIKKHDCVLADLRRLSNPGHYQAVWSCVEICRGRLKRAPGTTFNEAFVESRFQPRKDSINEQMAALRALPTASGKWLLKGK